MYKVKNSKGRKVGVLRLLSLKNKPPFGATAWQWALVNSPEWDLAKEDCCPHCGSDKVLDNQCFNCGGKTP